MGWLILTIGIVLILVHRLWPDLFMVDAISVLILFILSIPFVARYLRRAKFPGAEFEFKDEIRETEKLVQLSVEKAEESKRDETRKVLPFETFQLSNARELLDSDSILALAALRIEIERTLSYQPIV